MRYCRLFALVVSVLLYARPGLVSASKGSNVTASDIHVLEHGPPNELQDARIVEKEAEEDWALPSRVEKAANNVAKQLDKMRNAFFPSAASVGGKTLNEGNPRTHADDIRKSLDHWAASAGTTKITADEELAHIWNNVVAMKELSRANQGVNRGYSFNEYHTLADMMFSRPSFLKKYSLKTGKMTSKAVNDVYKEYKEIISNDLDLAVLIQLAKDFGTPPAKRNAESMEKVQFEAWTKANVDPKRFPLDWNLDHSVLRDDYIAVDRVRGAYETYRPAK
ncbi:unnamed protein product [Hyaloperonospora brassicae]|uniref:RxLR effector protein n=1 Tax=Hyaloperonospora brassicae TaxID=162125 RepID=A0AAV0TK01_HYABA|nr:unnamed protein product [Hyaloperonospora brassicae]